MKKLLFIILILSSCIKSDMRKYWITNDSENTLTIYTSEKQYNLSPKNDAWFYSESSKTELKFKYDNPELKIKVVDSHTSPAHLIISGYLYNFKVTIAGQADSAYFSLNESYHKVKLPFKLEKNIDSYQVYVKPINPTGSVWTQIFVNACGEQYFESVNGEECLLTGNTD